MDASKFANSPCGKLVPFRGTDGRTGRSFEHVAFVADPLGAEPELSPDTWHAINAANRAVARLDQASRQVPSPSLLLSPTLRREAQSTSALEGTYAPLQEVFAADTEPDVGRSSEMREILNYVDAANGAFAWLENYPKISLGMLEQCHRILARGTESETTDAGRVRRTPVVIGSPSGSVEDARFVPMPPGNELQAAMTDLVDWIGADAPRRDPLVAAGIAHYQFETLHPFNDGNGRIGRLLIVLQFMATGLVSQPLLSVSPWFEARRAEYQERLAEVSATGDWNGWLQFFCRGVEASAIDTARRVDRLLAIQRRYVELVLESTTRGGGVMRDIAEILIGRPVVTVPMLAAEFDRTQQAVNTAVKRLVELGVLLGPIGQYNRQFLARDVYFAISAPMGEVPDPDEPLVLDGPV